MSVVCHIPVEITCADLVQFFQVPNAGSLLWPLTISNPDFNWTAVNQVIHESGSMYHLPKIHTLTYSANLIQLVLRNTIFQKGGDYSNITHALSLATYYIQTNTTFNVAQALISILKHVTKLQDAKWKQNLNLPLGHIIDLVLVSKYNLNTAGMEMDCHPRLFEIKDFRALKVRPQIGHMPEEEEMDIDVDEEDAGANAPPAMHPDMYERLVGDITRVFDHSFQAIRNDIQNLELQMHTSLDPLTQQVEQLKGTTELQQKQINELSAYIYKNLPSSTTSASDPPAPPQFDE